MNDNFILLLIGPKGCGKSFIGSLMEKKFNIKFVRVEDWVMEIKKDRNIDDQSYLKEVFQKIEKGIRALSVENSDIVFESTGLTKYFDSMLKSLKKDFKVITIKIDCDEGLCLERVKNRDSSIHINISDDEVKYINDKVFEKNIPTDFKIDNNKKSEIELTNEIRNIIKIIFNT